LPLAAVGSFRLSDRARAELVAIYDDSEARFGSYQADAYLAGLERTFGLLADFPGIGQAADYLKAGFRRFRFQAHVVFYVEGRDGVVIRAVVHGARDIRPGLFE
jgi:toxin ParE1/3/4